MSEEKNDIREDKPKKSNAFKIGIIIFSVLFVGFIAIGVMSYTGVFEQGKTACVIGGENISQAEYDFNYKSNYTNFISYYGDYLSAIGLDTTKDLSLQKFSDTMTWAQFFDNQTYTQLRQTVAYAAEAKKQGLTLNDDDKATVDEFIANLKTAADKAGSSLGDYIKSYYGKAVTEGSLRSAAERLLLADRFATEKQKSFTYDNASLEEYYQKNKDTYDQVKYRSYVFAADIPEKADGQTDEAYKKIQDDAKAAAKAKADAMLAALTDEASFNDIAKQNAPEAEKAGYSDPDKTLTVSNGKNNVSETGLADWLYDASRKAGEKTVIEGDSGSTVVYFLSRARSEEQTVNVRHILVPFDPANVGATASPTDEQKTTAKKTADELYKSWQDKGATEDAFSALAKEKGTDSTKSAGGLMTNVASGQMVGNFDTWCFDKARKAGDSGIVETEYGYHLVYFSGFAGPEWKAVVTQARQAEDFNAFKDELLKSFPVVVNGKTVLPEPESVTDTSASDTSGSTSSDASTDSATTSEN